MCSIETAARNRQLGVTLVELMVALVLGLLLTAGMIKVFSGNRVTYEFNQSLSRIQENARFALDHMAWNARMAGYQGCMADVDVYNNLDGANSFRDDIRNGIQGFDAIGTSEGDDYTAVATNPDPASADVDDWSPALPPELDDLVIPGSDVLVVRSVGGSGISLIAPFTDSASVKVSPTHDFVIGEILVVSDCTKASIFQVTSINAVTHNITHSNASLTPGNALSNWPPEQDYGLGAEVARLQAHAFYIGREAPDGPPSLYQLRLQVTTAGSVAGFQAEELVEGIESMQVRYGVDADNNETIDSWASADAVADWSNVLSVEVSLLARAAEEYGSEVDTADYTLGGTTFDPVDDRRLRQVFSTTVGVRNRLP